MLFEVRGPLASSWWTSTSASASSTTGATASTLAAAASSTCATAALLGTVVDEQSIERKRVRKYVIPNVGTPNGKRIEILRLLVFDGHLDGLEMRVHGDVDARHGAVNLRSVLQLDRHSLMTQLH